MPRQHPLDRVTSGMKPRVETTPAHVEDAWAIATVHIRSWKAAYAGMIDPDYLASLSIEDRSIRWQATLAANADPILVARLQGEVAGFVSYGKCRDQGAPLDRGEIWALYVSPSAWGQGLGRTLIQQAMDELATLGFESISLWVLSANHRGRKFYESCGFERVPGSEKCFDLGGHPVEEVAYLRDGG